MKLSGWTRLWIVGAVLALAGCGGPKKPPHYYVLCEDVDGAGWKLIDYEKDEQGYLMSCTYQSPDRRSVRIDSCRADGCD